MTDKVRVGIIGVGQIGKQHIRKYANVPEAEIVAVADVRQDEANHVAQENGIPSVYVDYRELLQRDDIDSVDVCLHNRLHAPVTIDALEAGKNVYCEKPMSWAYGEAKRMADTAQRTGRMLHIQLSTLYQPEARAAQRIIQDGHLGEIYYAKSCHYRRRGRPYVDGYGTAQFVQRSTAGGGAMLDGQPLEKHFSARRAVPAFEAFCAHAAAGTASPDALYLKANRPLSPLAARLFSLMLNGMVSRRIRRFGHDPRAGSPCRG